MKTKKIIATTIFVLIMLVLKAQDKYEYATVIYFQQNLTKANVGVSADGKYTQTELKITEGSPQLNLTSLLEIVNKMSEEGWEVYSSNSEPGNVYYFLRKKKKEKQ